MIHEIVLLYYFGIVSQNCKFLTSNTHIQTIKAVPLKDTAF